MDILNNIIDWLNCNAGVVSFFALLAAVFVPFIIYKLQRKNQRLAMKDKLDAINEFDNTILPREFRDQYVEENTLRKGLGRK